MSGMMLQQCCCGGGGNTCWYKWVVTWDCETSSWGTVTLDDSGCGTAPETTDVWTFESSTSTTCTYTIYIQSEVSCESAGDCSGHEGSAPTAPDAPDEDCDCYTYGLPPCDNCTGTQDDITVETNAYDCPCQLIDGGTNTFAYNGFSEDANICLWTWLRDADYCSKWPDYYFGVVQVQLTYEKSSETWTVIIYYQSGGPDYQVTGLPADTFKCIGGKLTGSAEVPGLVASGRDCSAFTATVTL